jgi:hypothetical protein
MSTHCLESVQGRPTVQLEKFLELEKSANVNIRDSLFKYVAMDYTSFTFVEPVHVVRLFRNPGS